MTDLTSNPPRMRSPQARRRGLEFQVYFALIFALALPFATVRWMREAIRYRTLDLRGPLARAWAEADRTTPLIFSA
ncbi:PufQ cytochrome subunit [Roseovarius azorensis]|uniref:PufQ cytochrome subunit n=1 Tax=Roseovarius azorensis TaxID=1287727 RepID=A0A1H7TC29_9RHOB|nr:cytochrome PufQ [Roseovarius azorensis]SEL82351.1 PufQ cytochrome subunit [Roseovarius azorensis]